MHILVRCRKTNSRFALRHVFRRALHCGGMVPEEISESPLAKIGLIKECKVGE